MDAGTLIPIFCVTAKRDKGVRELLDALSRYGLSPSVRPQAPRRVADRQQRQRRTSSKPTEQEEFVGQVFKVMNDKFVGHLSFIRVIAGKIQHNHNVVNLAQRRDAPRRVTCSKPRARARAQVHEAGPGDIVAIAKVEGLEIGDTIAYTNHAPKLPPPHVPDADVRPRHRAEGPRRRAEDFNRAAQDRRAEDPTVKVTHDAQTHELVISGVSQLHLDIIRERLKARFGVEVNTKEPKIPYRETITADGAGEHKHKKQTGGRVASSPTFTSASTRCRARSPGPGAAARSGVREQEQVREAAERATTTRVQLRVPRPHRRRHDPEQLPAGDREGVQGDAGTRGVLAGYRVQDCAVEVSLREVPRRGLVGSGVQDGRPARRSAKRSSRRGRRCSNRS